MTDKRETLRILVLEDESVIGMLIEDILLDMGVDTVDLASTVEEGMIALDATSPHFAILDIQVNGSWSYPLADKLGRRGIPFVFISGYGPGGLDTRYAAFKTIPKPFRPEDIETALRDAGFAVKSEPAAL